MSYDKRQHVAADVMADLNLSSIASGVERLVRVEYRDPFRAPYGDEERTTRSQRLAWRFLHARTGRRPVIAMIGAKGSSKTHFGAAFAHHQGQTFPGSMGCVISNTYTQAKDNAGALFVKMTRQLGYRTTFRNSTIIGGRPYSQLFVTDLDGTGFDTGLNFYMLVRSFEAVDKLEGIELDWLWIEEIQDADRDSVATAVSRVRGQVADQAIFIAGMPHDELHWQYEFIPAIGAMEEAQMRLDLGYEPFDPKHYENGEPIPKEDIPLEDHWAQGVFFEPSIFENQHNLPEGYIQSLRDALDEVRADRWIYGRRTSMRGNKVAYAYDDHIHRKGRMSEVLSHYDPAVPLILSVDFNTSPMCAVLWQEKPWSDGWLKPDTEGNAPDRTVLAQVDEFEVWEGGTRGLMREFKSRYSEHWNGITVIGDATGNREDTRSGTTDWRIIREELAGWPNVSIIPGLQSKTDFKTGKTTYSNPPRVDTFNVLNAALRDSQGRAWVCFVPESELKSKGAAASVAMLEKKPDGTVDDSNDKKAGQEIHRTHFFDCVRYAVWYFRGGDIEDQSETFDRAASMIFEESVFGGNSWGASDSGGDSWAL